jgi:hypothetical protein
MDDSFRFKQFFLLCSLCHNSQHTKIKLVVTRFFHKCELKRGCSFETASAIIAVNIIVLSA